MIRTVAIAAALSFPVGTAAVWAQTALPALSTEEALKARWQRLLREADDRIHDAEHGLESAKHTHDAAARQAVLMTTGHSMAARATAIEALKKAESDLEAARKAKVDLLEQARRENVPPGYLR